MKRYSAHMPATGIACDRERPPARTVAKDDVVYCHRDVADLLGISATEAAEERVHRR